MTEVIASENEPIDSLVRRFNRKVQADGILTEARRREYFEKPSAKRKKKEAVKRRKSSFKKIDIL
ncbi:MAG: 30S ribosomal protein S21 [Dehalococcoidia bacterium]|nr:30S ribosomal protein S21 [Dehalococcoidia bacterium]